MPQPVSAVEVFSWNITGCTGSCFILKMPNTFFSSKNVKHFVFLLCSSSGIHNEMHFSWIPSLKVLRKDRLFLKGSRWFQANKCAALSSSECAVEDAVLIEAQLCASRSEGWAVWPWRVGVGSMGQPVLCSTSGTVNNMTLFFVTVFCFWGLGVGFIS